MKNTGAELELEPCIDFFASSAALTVSRQITKMSNNILSQGVSNIQNLHFKFFAIVFKIDETADVASLAEFCILVHYVYNKHLEDRFLFCKTLSTKTTTREIFDKVDRFIEVHGIRWKHVIVMCTDDAPVMLGCHFRLVKEKSPYVISTHCTIYCQALMVKNMSDECSEQCD